MRQRAHFERFEAEQQGKKELYNLVGVKADGTRVTIAEGGKELPATCAQATAEKLNEDEDMGRIFHLSLDLVWDEKGLALVPAGSTDL